MLPSVLVVRKFDWEEDGNLIVGATMFGEETSPCVCCHHHLSHCWRRSSVFPDSNCWNLFLLLSEPEGKPGVRHCGDDATSSVSVALSV
jgi:hypothetical protein